MNFTKIILMSIVLTLPLSLMAQSNNQMGSYSQTIHGDPSHINTYDEAINNQQVSKISNEPINVGKNAKVTEE